MLRRMVVNANSHHNSAIGVQLGAFSAASSRFTPRQHPLRSRLQCTGMLDWSYTMTVPIEALANLQSDFGAKDCRDSLINHIRTHESRVDPSTPIANYLSSQSPALTAIAPLQEFAPIRVQRLEAALVLLKQLFGKDARWGMIKESWTKNLLNGPAVPLVVAQRIAEGYENASNYQRTWSNDELNPLSRYRDIAASKYVKLDL